MSPAMPAGGSGGAGGATTVGAGDARAVLRGRSLPESPHAETDFGNPPWAGADLRVLIARLSPFRDVERSTPHQFLFRELRDAADGAAPDTAVYADFSFFPPERERDALSAGGQPWLRGIASGRGAAEFDLVLVSNAYTLELVNLAPALARSGIPPSRDERDRLSRLGTRFPVIALGGSNAMAAGAVAQRAAGAEAGDSFADCLFFGEGEGRAGTLALGLARASRLGFDARLAAIDALAAATEGLWHTRSLRPVRQAKAVGGAYPRSAPPLLAGEESGTVRLEITRGCPGFCSFCFEGWERKPYRETPLAEILAEARRLKAACGADCVELASYNFNAHSDIVAVIRGLSGLFDRVNFMSQRADILARVPGLAALEDAAGKRSFTLGVEGVSARARAYYSKELTEAQALAAFRALLALDPREISLFYVLSGLEDGADLSEFSAFVSRLAAAADERPRRPRVIFSAGALVRMPFTPLAYEELALDPERYRPIAMAMEEAVGRAGFEFRGPSDWDEYRLSQVLALAPPGCFELLQELAARGCVYDRGLSRGTWSRARAFMEDSGMLGAGLLGAKDEGYAFALGFVEPAVSREFAYRRFLAARRAIESPSCFENPECAGCGACADGAERDAQAAHAIAPATAADIASARADAERKRKPFVTYHAAAISGREALAHPRYAAARFAAAAMAASPGLADAFLSAEDAFLRRPDAEPRLPGASGPTWYRVSWSRRPDPEALGAAGLVCLEAVPEPDGLSAELAFPGATVAEASAAVGEFLSAGSMPYTLKKDQAVTRFVISEKGRKKRNVLAARVAPGDGGGAVALLELGRKFDLGPLVARARARGPRPELRVARRSESGTRA